MKSNEINYTRMLYLSNVNFTALAAIGHLKFLITLLLAFPNDSCTAAVINAKTHSPSLAALNRFATIPQIIDVLKKEKLILYDYIIERKNLRLQTVVGNDLLLEYTGDGNMISNVISKVMASWELPQVKYSQNDIETITPYTLFDISPKDGTPNEVRDINNKNELINFLIQERSDDIKSKNKFVVKHRIYYTIPSA